MIIIEIINLKNYKYNYDLIKKITKKEIIPVIKSNAYGLGLEKVANTLKDASIIAANSIEEVDRLNKLKHNFQILFLNKLELNDYNKIKKFDNLILSVTSETDALNMKNYLDLSSIKVHIYIDTGMNRFGIKNHNEYKKVLEILSCDKFIIDGVYTHITSLNNYQKQKELFDSYLTIFKPRLTHVCATSTYMYCESYDACRIGLEIICSKKNYYKNVITLKAKAIELRVIEQNQTLGYNEGYKANKKTYVAILPIGYSNGLDRRLTGYSVYCCSRYYKIIGVICMNHMFVEVDKTFNIQNEIEIISKNNSIHKMAEYLKTIPGEILTRLNFPKTYIE